MGKGLRPPAVLRLVASHGTAAESRISRANQETPNERTLVSRNLAPECQNCQLFKVIDELAAVWRARLAQLPNLDPEDMGQSE